MGRSCSIARATRADHRGSVTLDRAGATENRRPQAARSGTRRSPRPATGNARRAVKLKREIEAISADRATLNQQLIDSAAHVRDVEASIDATQARLKPLDERAQVIQTSLQERRAVIVEVLAALQRIGRQPPPALVVRPEDALQAVRTAIMLGAVVPEMRTQAEALAGDLNELLRVRKTSLPKMPGSPATSTCWHASNCG